MGMFDFFRAKKPIEDDVVEEIGFGDIGNWFRDKERVLRKDEVRILGEIGKRLDEFYVSVEEGLAVLEGVDIEGKKEHGRAKILVRQGLDKYINSVRVLLKNVGALGRDSLKTFAEDVGKTFGYFEKTSARFYGRATYLIGDEMAAVRNEIRRFYNGLVKTFEENKSLVETFGKIGDVNLKLKEVGEVEDNVGKAGEEIVANEEKIGKARESVGKLEGEIEKIRGGAEYVANLRVEDEIKGLGVGLDREVDKLKGLIDFKKLAGIVHSNERELGVVKEHKNHFALEFGRDGGKRIVGLLRACNMSPRDDSGEPNSSEIVAKIDLIRGMGAELEEKRGNVGVDASVVKLGEIKGIGEEIENLELENVKGGRRLKELDLKLKGLKNEVVLLVEGFGVKII